MAEPESKVGESWQQNVLQAGVLQLGAGERRVFVFDPIPDEVHVRVVAGTDGLVAVYYGDVAARYQEGAVPGAGTLWPGQLLLATGQAAKLPGRTQEMTVFCVATTDTVWLQLIAVTGFAGKGVDLR